MAAELVGHLVTHEQIAEALPQLAVALMVLSAACGMLGSTFLPLFARAIAALLDRLDRTSWGVRRELRFLEALATGPRWEAMPPRVQRRLMRNISILRGRLACATSSPVSPQQ